MFGMIYTWSEPLANRQITGVVYAVGAWCVPSLTTIRYIVYDVAQVEIKYLLKVDFKYKWWIGVGTRSGGRTADRMEAYKVTVLHVN